MNADAFGGRGRVHAAAVTLTTILRQGSTIGIEVWFTIFTSDIIHTDIAHLRFAIALGGAASEFPDFIR